MSSSLEQIRHSFAHLLARATLAHFPKAQLTLGPAIDNGFYYDIFTPADSPKIGDADLAIIEETMRKLLPTWTTFSHREVTRDEAKKVFTGNPFKLELIEEIAERGETITLYKSGDFEDLCRGGHIEDVKEMKSDAFKLSHVAGAYWRGDEKNPMLTRIYGLAFETKVALNEYVAQQEEAKKRDHKKLGVELDLFTFSELVGTGLPLWTPRGTLIRNILDRYVWELRERHDYEQVEIPHITKKDLYIKSGHWEKYQNDLFRVSTREGHEFVMKPMNCPHHTQIYARKPWSYRELPQRYANSTMCYRDEQSGELSGLSRVRAFTQDDAHVFCRMSQAKEEFVKIWDIIHEFYGSFGFDLRVRISKHDPAHPEKYLGEHDSWVFAENMLAEIAKEKEANAFEGIGEAAFYGPKLDFMAKDAIGREWQVATIQLDMNMPERFDLNCTNEKGTKERIVMIHAAIMGSIERFLSILIEHTGGLFPLWLSPVQVTVLPIGEAHQVYAREVMSTLHAHAIRATVDASGDSLGKRIRDAKMKKVPYTLVIGDQEIASKGATLESRDAGKVGQLPLTDIITRFEKEITEKK